MSARGVATSQAVLEPKERSFAGYYFCLNDDRWRLSRDVCVTLDWMHGTLTPLLEREARCVLRHYARVFSANHASNMCRLMSYFAAYVSSTKGPLDAVCAPDLLNYRSTLIPHLEYRLGALVAFFRAWRELGFRGVDEQALLYLNDLRLRGNVKGLAVQTLCPVQGPLTDLEYAALHQAIAQAFAEKSMSPQDFLLVKLFLSTGRRPAQLADLKIGDLEVVCSDSGHTEYFLNIPRRKQRGLGWRKQFKPFLLAPELGKVLRDYTQALAPTAAAPHLPIFPRQAFQPLNSPLVSLDEGIQPADYLHCTSQALAIRLQKVVSSLRITSERRETPLRVFPTRLRRTLATRAAREGYGEMVIAELLDHTDTQNARVYTENVPEHVDAIDESVARQMAPLAQAFAGVLVAHESQARRGDDLRSRIRSESGAVGTCGHYGFCGAAGPIACYTCHNFQPWVDGPHKDILAALISEREYILKLTEDATIAAVNDRTIFAVAQVVELCERQSRSLTCDEA